MDLKRYRRKTIQDALRAVREDLGPQALVLSTRVVDAGGVRGWLGGSSVEVTAAASRISVSDDRHLQAPSAPAAGRPADTAANRGTDAIAARLEAIGLDRALAHDVAKAHPVTGRRGASAATLARTLAEQLAPLTIQDEGYAPIEVFIGPPGAGKTTTIAKIASQERARTGKRLGLCAGDGFRVGAVEQLRLYATILAAPFIIARTPAELEAALDQARKPLLVDTAGRSPSDQASRDMLRVLAGRRDVRTHLVIAASTPATLVSRQFDRFAEARPTRVVLTKLDEAESLAPLVPVLRERQLPVSYLGIGQAVPEDLQRATPAALAAWVSGEALGRTFDAAPGKNFNPAAMPPPGAGAGRAGQVVQCA
jgi:flagellar biosynthesis protein FlhF